MSLLNQRIIEIKEALRAGELKPSDLVDESLRRIEEVDGDVKAFLRLNPRVREEAERLDQKLQAHEERGILFGLPIGIKDNIVTKGLKTTCASKLLANYQPIYDATVTEKVRQADAAIIGMLNMDEFAMGSSTENSAFQLTRNPWNLDYVPGGSSGGSAAAVAAGEVYFALGSDTGGSIRQPAAFCGVVGLKPTYGLISRYGLVAFASSLDQIGPITKNVEDAAYLLAVIAGYDEKDSTSARVDIPDYVGALTGEIRGLKIGLPKEYLGEGIDGEVREIIYKAVRQLEDLGAELVEISLPHTEYAVATYYILASSEASSNLARFDGVRYGVRVEGENLIDMYQKTRSLGFGDEVKRRIMLGTYSLSSGYYDAYYRKAQKVRTLIKRDFEEAFRQVDVIVSPTAPTTAFRIGEKTDDPLTMYLNDILTIPVNLAGIPAISIPAGFHSNGLPVGLQIMGKPFDEMTILNTAYTFEQHTDHHKRKPTLRRGEK